MTTSNKSSAKGSRKRKNQTVRQMVEKKATPAPNVQPSDFADIHLPEVEQYRQIYGANLNVCKCYIFSYLVFKMHLCNLALIL